MLDWLVSIDNLILDVNQRFWFFMFTFGHHSSHSHNLQKGRVQILSADESVWKGGGVTLIDWLFLTPYSDNVCMVGGLVLKPGLPTKDETLRLDE